MDHTKWLTRSPCMSHSADARSETTRLNDGMQKKKNCVLKQIRLRQTTQMRNSASQLFVLRPTETSLSSFHIIKLYVMYMLCMDGTKWDVWLPQCFHSVCFPHSNCRCGRKEMTKNFRLCEIIMLRGAGL